MWCVWRDLTCPPPRQMYAFRTMLQSMYTLIQAILGNFDFTLMWEVSPILAPILFLSFVVVSIIVLLNLIIGILSCALDAALEETRVRDTAAAETEAAWKQACALNGWTAEERAQHFHERPWDQVALITADLLWFPITLLGCGACCARSVVSGSCFVNCSWCAIVVTHIGKNCG